MTAKKHSSEENDESMKEEIQKRFKSMFSGKGEPLSNMSLQEVEALKARIADLEAKLQEPSHETPSDQQTRSGQEAPAASAMAEPEPQPAKAVPAVIVPRPSTASIPPVRPAEAEPFRTRNVFRLIVIFLLATASVVLFLFYQAQKSPSWQLSLSLVQTSLLLILMGAGLWLARRNRPQLGVWLTVLPWLVVLLSSSFVFSGMGLGMMVLAIMISSLAAIITLPGRQMYWLIGTGIVFGVLILLTDRFNPTERATLAGFGLVTVLIAIVGLLVFGFMAIQQFRNYSLRTKILLLGITSVVITAVTVVMVIEVQSRQYNDLAQAQVEQSVDTDLTHITEGVYNMVKAQDDLVQQMVNYNLNVAEQVLNSAGQLTLSEETVQWAAVNQFNQKFVQVQLPKMLVGTTWLGRNTSLSVKTPVVDEVQNLVGGTTTIFQRMNQQGDMLRVATNVQTVDGQRAIGTYIPAIMPDGTANPVISAILSGQTYRGNAYVVNAWYDTAYRPIQDESGSLIGMLFVGVKQQNVETLRQAILRTDVGKTGYAYVLGSDGNDQGRYIISRHGERDGENVWEVRDAEGNYVIQTIINKALSLQPGETALVRYQWQEPNQAARWKLARIAYYAPWHWVIAASIDESELLASQNTLQAAQGLMVNISGGAALAIALFISFLSVIIARSITRPVGHLAAVATQIAAGNLDVTAKLDQHDELGVLAAAFNDMTGQLRSSISSLEERTRDLRLASEVGRTITEKVANMDEMLTAAVEMIRSRFNLYYTQVYLTDPNGHALALRAGTGEVGKQLLARRHTLLIDASSLNGRAVLEKKPIVVADTLQSATFKPNPLLPNTRSEMVIPLIAANQVIGALDMQSEQPEALNENSLVAFLALAEQLAIAIQNAALFAEVQEARAEVEAQMIRFTKAGWQDFLNAIQQGHRIGFAFDDSRVLRLQSEALAMPAGEDELQVPITLTGAKIGEIRLPANLEEGELQLVRSVGSQLAQHAENLRLIAQAERYRAEAEQALRRLTHEGWESFLQAYDKSRLGYSFDLNEVKALSEESQDPSAYAARQVLAIGNEIIGELAIDTPDQMERAAEVLAAVAEQLSGHIENLRLSELNEKHAQREQTLRQLTSALRSSTNPTTIVRTAVKEVGRIMGRRTMVQVLAPGQANPAEPLQGKANEADSAADQS